MSARSRLLGAAALAAGGGLALWEVQRRRDLAAVRRDPHWRELNQTLHGAEMQVHSADGTRLHVEMHGPDGAPAVVLVHGWMESLELWQLQVRALVGTHRVIVYDQRGHGRSAVPDDIGAYTVEHLADDLDAVLDACLGDGERCVVAGHSMGGMTVIGWAGRHPERVARRLRGALLVNTATHELHEHVLFLGPLAGAGVRAALMPRAIALYRPLTTQLEPISYRVVRRIVAGRDSSPAEIAFYHRMFLSCPAPVMTGFGRMLSGLDLRESRAALTVPAVVIAGGDDRLLPPVHSRGLAASLPRLMEYVELDGVGHMAPVEAADVVIEHLRRLWTQDDAAAEPALREPAAMGSV